MTELPKFKFWSQTNIKAREKLCPNVGLQEWTLLTSEDKSKILLHFQNDGWLRSTSKLFWTISALNKRYKKKSFGQELLHHSGNPHYGEYSEELESCCKSVAYTDFKRIFASYDEDVIFELLSVYAFLLVDHNSLTYAKNSSDEARRLNYIIEAFEEFDAFSKCLNDIFEQFGVNSVLTRNGFVPRQDKKITKEIWEPVLEFLSDPKWKDVTRELSDAFQDYRKNSIDGYSGCITHAISSLEAFLQMIAYGETGAGKLSDLISNTQKQGLIPNDLFSKRIFKDIEAVLMSERQSKGDAHPKREYATEKHARLVLNLIMVFFQHCLS